MAKCWPSFSCLIWSQKQVYTSQWLARMIVLNGWDESRSQKSSVIEVIMFSIKLEAVLPFTEGFVKMLSHMSIYTMHYYIQILITYPNTWAPSSPLWIYEIYFPQSLFTPCGHSVNFHITSTSDLSISLYLFFFLDQDIFFMSTSPFALFGDVPFMVWD